MARLAKSLVTLREQINTLYPNRSKVNDGWIGDTKHSTRKSDHNPNPNGVVQALDITHDVKNNLDSYKLADILKSNKDIRIKYIISNGRIYNPSVSNTWRTYTGTNKHSQHVHISVSDNPKLYDDTTKWNLGAMNEVNSSMNKVNSSMDNKVDSNPVVLQVLPLGWISYILSDEGTKLELSTSEPGGAVKMGITLDTYRRFINPTASYIDLDTLTVSQAEDIYYKNYYLASRANLLPSGLDYLFFDTCINSGITGSTKILQRTVGTKDDGILGTITISKVRELAIKDINTLINNFANQRLSHIKGHKYERGLTNRILRVKERALKMAKSKANQPNTIVKDIDDVVVTVPVTETKPWYQSKVIWTSVIGACAYLTTVLTKGKINIDPSMQDTIANVIVMSTSTLVILFRTLFTKTKLT